MVPIRWLLICIIPCFALASIGKNILCSTFVHWKNQWSSRGRKPCGYLAVIRRCSRKWSFRASPVLRRAKVGGKTWWLSWGHLPLIPYSFRAVSVLFPCCFRAVSVLCCFLANSLSNLTVILPLFGLSPVAFPLRFRAIFLPNLNVILTSFGLQFRYSAAVGGGAVASGHSVRVARRPHGIGLNFRVGVEVGGLSR